MILLHGQVGEQSLSNGTRAPVRISKNASLVLRDELSEEILKGRAFIVANQVGVTSQAGLSGTTPVLTLYNPTGSGVRGKLWMASAHLEVASVAAASVWLAAGTNTVAAAVTGTLTTAHRNLKLGSAGVVAGSQGNRVVPLLAATLPAAPVAIDLIGVGLTGAITTVPALSSMSKFYPGGCIYIEEGCNISIQTSTASGAAGLLCSYIWSEEEK